MTMDTMEKVLPSAEENDKREEKFEDERQDETAHKEEHKKVQEGGDDKEEVEEEKPQPAGKIKRQIPLAIQPRDKKQAEGLNLNNEVVKMRREVKRVRALIIRKLTRQIRALKKKKGKDTEIERNQRRAARLLEEIHAMKVISPDLVTKTALHKNLNFIQLCQNPKSTISDRAVTRIATHPQFNKRIEEIKAALKAFKGERSKAGRQEGMVKGHTKVGNINPDSPDNMRERQSTKEEEITVEQRGIIENEEDDSILEVNNNATVAKLENKTHKPTNSAEVLENKNVRRPSIKRSEVKEIIKNTTQAQDAEKTYSLNSAPEVTPKKKDEEESDCELLDDEEKEYFDDSTEERFHKQSSQSEVSDDDDDFFVGKVNKFKKKKQKNVEGKREVKADTTDQVQSELDVVESQLKAKATLFQSVFCSSLSAPKPESAGRRRDRDTFRSQEVGGSCPNSGFNKESKFQKQEKGTECNSESTYKPCISSSHPESRPRGFPSFNRRRGRGRVDVIKQKVHSYGGVFCHQAQNQALHPSWEASKKRKEQQGRILAFQGKKIKFDD
uniref:serum response factor-binding protein 1 n=1 Tax=Semicossyphus pulcher TaxID=241346 RepID=UPI0037E90EC3